MAEAPTPTHVILVAATTDTAGLAGSITETLREKGIAAVHAIGAAAVNQALKGVIVSRGHLVTGGLDLMMVPSFFTTVIDNKDMTGVRLLLTLKT